MTSPNLRWSTRWSLKTEALRLRLGYGQHEVRRGRHIFFAYRPRFDHTYNRSLKMRDEGVRTHAPQETILKTTTQGCGTRYGILCLDAQGGTGNVYGNVLSRQLIVMLSKLRILSDLTFICVRSILFFVFLFVIKDIEWDDSGIFKGDIGSKT